MVSRGTSPLTVLKRGFICSEDSSISTAARAQTEQSAIVTLSKQLRFPYETVGKRLLREWQRRTTNATPEHGKVNQSDS